MPGRFRFSLINVLLALTCIALTIGWWATVKPPKPVTVIDRSPGDDAIRSLPITISMSEDHGLMSGWYFSVNSAGEGQLTIPSDIETRLPVKVTREQLSELREMLITESFFNLKTQYGQLVPDGGSQNLTITLGDTSQSVRIDFLMNWVAANEVEKLQEPARALRLWMLIRSWFPVPLLPDSKQYDQRVLDAVKAGTQNTSDSKNRGQ